MGFAAGRVSCRSQKKGVADVQYYHRRGFEYMEVNDFIPYIFAVLVVLLALIRIFRKPQLTYPRHYKQTSRQAPGKKCDMLLVHADIDGPVLTLVYQWSANLSYDEADRLDTRARAYIACAIFDAAIAARLFCRPGPPHGRRPSWYIAGEEMPVTLVDAGFDVSNKTCFMHIGAGIMRLRVPQSGNLIPLISGFQTRFSQIRV